PAVQLVGEGLAFAVAEGGGATGVHAAAAQLVHEIAQAEPFANVFGGVERAARIERDAALFDHQRGERHVGGDDEIPRFHHFDDARVSNVETGGNLDEV